MIKALPSSRCSKGFLCPAVGILPALVSRPLGCFGVQRVDDGCGVVVDYCEERPCWRLRLAAAGFPILHVVEAETERDGELGLRETEAFADGLHIDLSGEGGLVAFGISLEVGLDLAKSVHEFVECGGHGLSLPVCVENSVCAFLKFVSLCLGKIGFLVLRKDRDEEDGKPLIAPDVNNASAPAFSHALAGNTNLPETSGPTHDISRFRVGCDETHDVGTVFLAEKFVRDGEVGRCFDNGLHDSVVRQWTP
jgi:hypothetical protein